MTEIRQTQEEKDRICNAEIARLEKEWTEASKNRLALVVVSAKRRMVVELSYTVPCAGTKIFKAQVIHGPASLDSCISFIEKWITDKKKNEKEKPL